MSYYLLATLKVKYGQQRKFYEVMSHLKPVLERSGWKLVGAYENAIGRLNTVIDLWEIDDPNAVSSTLAAVSKDSEFVRWAAHLPELLDEEVLANNDEGSIFAVIVTTRKVTRTHVGEENRD